MGQEYGWVRENLINRFETLEEGDGWRRERTGLHEMEFIETRRTWFTKVFHADTGGVSRGSCHVVNLVEGREAVMRALPYVFTLCHPLC